MNIRRLGRTELQVSELALGGLFVSSHGADFENARAAVSRAAELGINYVDTAPGYCDSEAVLGRLLPGLGKPFLVSTKLGGRPLPFDARDPAQLRASVHESLRLLGRDVIDVLMVHEPDRPGQYDWWSEAWWQGATRPEGPVLQVLEELKREGVVRFCGLGGTTAYEMARLCSSGCFDVVLTAFNFSLLWREAELSVLPAAAAQDMGIVVGSPLQQGALALMQPEVQSGAPWISPPRLAQFRALYKLVQECGIALPALGLRFALSHPAVSCVLSGVRSAHEVEENVAAANAGPLDSGLLARLDEIAAMVPARPAGEPASLPFGQGYRGPGALS